MENTDKSFKCGRKKQDRKENEIWVPFYRFNKDQLSVTMNKKGLMTISAAKESIEDTNRNGQRKTVVVEETVQIPSYVLDGNQLDQVKGEYKSGNFVITLPEKPENREQKSSEEAKEGPVEIEIMSE